MVLESFIYARAWTSFYIKLNLRDELCCGELTEVDFESLCGLELLLLQLQYCIRGGAIGNLCFYEKAINYPFHIWIDMQTYVIWYVPDKFKCNFILYSCFCATMASAACIWICFKHDRASDWDVQSWQQNHSRWNRLGTK